MDNKSMKSIVQLLFISILLLSVTSVACESPYQLRVGAFFNSNSVVTFWSDFIQQLSAKTKCDISILPSPTFKSYVIDLINKDGDIFLSPDYYAHTLQSYGFVPVLKIISPTKLYLITQKQYDPNNLETLVGKSISVPSIYSIGYGVTKVEFEKLGLFDTINYVFGDTFQTNSIKVLKGESDATVIFSPIYDSLPQPIKDKLNAATVLENTAAAYIMVKPGTSQILIDAIQTSHKKINYLEWAPTDLVEKKHSASSVFEKQFSALLRKAELKNMPQ
jgi:hypothetical protein